MRRLSVRVFPAAAIFLAAGSNIFPCSVAAAEEDRTSPSSWAEKLRTAHQRLLEIPDGWVCYYRLVNEEADPNKPNFVYPGGAEGMMAVRWPRMRSKVFGKMVVYQSDGSGTPKQVLVENVREADHDFLTWKGAGREGNTLLQITDFRHAFSSRCAYPLTFQYFAEMEQEYYPGEKLESETALPNAIEQHEYAFLGIETLDGVECGHLAREGFDELWIAQSRGFAVVKRELRFGPGKPIQETLAASDFREHPQGIWWPMRQVRERFDSNTGALRHRLIVETVEFRVGGITDALVHLDAPERPESVEDFVNGTVTVRFADEGEGDAVLLAAARKNIQLRGMPRTTHAKVYAGIAVLGAMLLGVLWWRLVLYV